MKPLFDGIKETAVKCLEQDGHLSPMFFLAQGEVLVYKPIPMVSIDKAMGDNLNQDDAKSRAVFVMGALAKTMKANRVLMVWDAAFRAVPPGQDFSDETERPLLYPKSMRTECIIINDFLLPSGETHTDVIPYKGGDGQPVEFLPNTFPKGAEMVTRFTGIILSGYNRAPTKKGE